MVYVRDLCHVKDMTHKCHDSCSVLAIYVTRLIYMLQCVAVYCNVLHCGGHMCDTSLSYVCDTSLSYVAVCCSVLYSVWAIYVT